MTFFVPKFTIFSPKSCILLATYLFFFAVISIEIWNLFSLVFTSLDSPILYEDSVVLIPAYSTDSLKYIGWLIQPHNGHFLLFPKLTSDLISYGTKSPIGFYNILINTSFQLMTCLVSIFLLRPLNLSLSCKVIYSCIFISLILSPWNWENLIWEFQSPWFFVQFIVILGAFIIANSYKPVSEIANEFASTRIFINLERFFIILSPTIAIFCSGHGYAFAFSLFVIYLLGVKKLHLLAISLMVFIAFLGVFAIAKSYFGFDSSILVKNNFSLLSFCKYLVAALSSSAFSASVNAFSKTASSAWIVPLTSSAVLILVLIFVSIKLISLFAKLNISPTIFIPASFLLLFSFSFLCMIAFSRSGYGFHQALVSRYFVLKSLLPLGLLYFNANISSQLCGFPELRVYCFKKINQLMMLPACIYVLLFLVNFPSFITTCYQSHDILRDRQYKFELFAKRCDPKLKIFPGKTRHFALDKTLSFASRDPADVISCDSLLRARL